jgi:hypothetical protein
MMDHIAEHPRCAVFAGMGSGKTGAVLHALSRSRCMDEGPGLILGPKRVARDVWPDEARSGKSSGIEVSRLSARPTQRRAALGRDAAMVLDQLREHPVAGRASQGKDRKWPFRTIVADESTRLKGARAMGQGGQRTNALAKVAFLPQVKRFVELTGTPAPNGLKDMWGQMMYVDQGERLGTSYTAFMARWFQRSFDGHGVDPLPFAQEQIQERIRDVCLTVDPRTISTSAIRSRPTSWSSCRSRRWTLPRDGAQMFLELSTTSRRTRSRRPHAAARTSKCLQIAAGFVYNDQRQAIPIHEAKLEALDSIREEANGMPLLVSYIFREDLAMLKKKFPQLRHIDEVDTSDNGDWNMGRIPMMAAHPASAGHGLNLQWGSNILVDYTVRLGLGI